MDSASAGPIWLSFLGTWNCLSGLCSLRAFFGQLHSAARSLVWSTLLSVCSAQVAWGLQNTSPPSCSAAHPIPPHSPAVRFCWAPAFGLREACAPPSTHHSHHRAVLLRGVVVESPGSQVVHQIDIVVGKERSLSLFGTVFLQTMQPDFDPAKLSKETLVPSLREFRALTPTLQATLKGKIADLLARFVGLREVFRL